MKRKAIQGSSLERNAKSDREIFEALLQRAKETGVSGGLPASNIRIVDAADLPRVPISPRKGFNMLVSLLGGLVVSVGMAFFFDYLDKGINSPDALKAQLGLHCLGLVPLIASHEASVMPLLSNGVAPSFKEAFRAVRTNVIFASEGESSQTLLITSTGPHEGKTLVATNLAIALAHTNQRVLLVDADMRRPQVHQVFQVPQDPGLSELARGRVHASQVIRQSNVEGLWLLTAGTVPPNPSELLSSPQFRQFVSALGKAFNWVIIDSPPVMAVTDASVIANIAAGVLFVVGADQTLSRTASNALDQLEAARARFVGAVLNRVDLDRNAFFYRYYYRREYTDYYSRPTAS
jgi:capsular exopolysaccharide synthesis family protein